VRLLGFAETGKKRPGNSATDRKHKLAEDAEDAEEKAGDAGDEDAGDAAGGSGKRAPRVKVSDDDDGLTAVKEALHACNQAAKATLSTDASGRAVELEEAYARYEKKLARASKVDPRRSATSARTRTGSRSTTTRSSSRCARPRSPSSGSTSRIAIRSSATSGPAPPGAATTSGSSRRRA
jgi:hypothetical protein